MSSGKVMEPVAQLSLEPLLVEAAEADETHDDHELEAYRGLAQEAERTVLAASLLLGDWVSFDSWSVEYGDKHEGYAVVVVAEVEAHALTYIAVIRSRSASSCLVFC